MNYRNVLLGIGGALLIIGFGIYFQNSFKNEPTQNSKNTTPMSSGNEKLTQNTTSTKKWSVNKSSPGRGQYQKPSGESDGTVNIDGKIIFPSQTEPRPLKLIINYIKVDHPLPKKIDQLLEDDQYRKALSEYLSMPSSKNPNNPNNRRTKRITSKPDGSFQLEALPVGIYSAKVKQKGWTGSTGQLYFQTERGVSPIRLKAKKLATLSGKVLEDRGDPIPSAKIVLSHKNKKVSVDRQGRFTIEGITPGKPISLKVQADGYMNRNITLDSLQSGETKRKTITLQRSSGLKVVVRDSSDERVRSGKLLLRKSEKKKNRKSARSQSKRELRAVNPSGPTVFNPIPAGRYEVMLVSSPYIATPKIIDIRSGQTKKTTISAVKGTSITIRFRDRSGKKVNLRLRPSVKVYDSQNRSLEPGFRVARGSRAGLVKGYLHPNTHRVSITVKPPSSADFRRVTQKFKRTDLPELSMKLPVSVSEGRSSNNSVQVKLLRPGENTSISPDDISFGHLSIIHVQSGSVIESHQFVNRTNRSRLKQFTLREEEYFVYGAITREGNNLVYFRRVTGGSNLPRIIRLHPRRAASITGSIPQKTRTKKGPLRVSLRFSNSSSADNKPPKPLITQLNQDGGFQIKHVPPGISFNLNIASRTTGQTIRKISIDPLGAGQNLKIGSID